ncbi:MAG: hypothetical protein J6S57_01970 [Alphaproteobacteria bacterium]|nr:hypothetical protein [Alphaproteobacteria bacterium]
MKKQIIVTLFVLLSGCSNVTKIEYEPVADGCLYSETGKPRKYLIDYFGFRDYELYVNYSGLSCKDMLQHELQHDIHKKPYDSINVAIVEEVAPLKVNVNNGAN